MRKSILILTTAAVLLAEVTPAGAQRLSLTRIFTNPASSSGDVLGPHQFGFSVGWLDGQVLIGAPGVDFGQPGDSIFLADHGAVYLFTTSEALLRTFSPTRRVTDTGHSVAAPGGQVLVGGPSVSCSTCNSGAQLFDPDTGTQVQAFEIGDVSNPHLPARIQFGFAVAAAGPGGTLAVVGAPHEEPAGADPDTNSGAAFVYDLASPVPLRTLLPPTTHPDGRFGSAVTAVGDGKVLVGAPGKRKAFLFGVDTGALVMTIADSGSEFGAAVATVGESLIIGAPGTAQLRGQVVVTNESHSFEHTLPTFSELTEPGGRFGAAVAGFGVHVLAGAPASDSAFVFVEGQGVVPMFSGIMDAGVVYIQSQDGAFLGTLVSPNPQPGEQFGAAIAVAGNKVLIGAPGAAGGRGVVYLFEDPAPVAFDQPVTTAEDTPVAFRLQAVDNDDGLVFAVVAGPVNGTLSGTPPNLTYTPRANFHGADKLEFKATDSAGFDSNVATVTITVSPVNDAPVALSQTVTVPANTSRQITLQATDVDGDPLSFLILSVPAGGTLSGTPPNLTYTPKPGFLGGDSFTFRVSDGKVMSNVATVKIGVLPGLTINDVSLNEGNSGTTSFVFTVRLSLPSSQTVSVQFATADKTAVAGKDYVATTGTLSFAPGETQKTVTVPVIRDQLFEPDETFLVVLSAPVNATIVDGTGVGTIVNDDPVLGESALTPVDATVAVGERLTLALIWTHPDNWHILSTIELRIIDDRGAVLWVRFHEGPDTLSLVNAANGKPGPRMAPGRPSRLETSAATLHLAESRVIGGGLRSVTLSLQLSFKPQAAGRAYRVEAFATDDAGNQQGFDPVGRLTVRPASHP